MKICAQSPLQAEYSLCGDAYDAPETEDDVEPFVIATRGQTVTCNECRIIIDDLQRGYTSNYRRTRF